jgi:hypothetical protein
MKPARPPLKDKSGTRHTKADHGGMKIMRARMKLAVSDPCPECPLRRDSTQGYLGGYSPEMYIDVLHSAASIACHSSKGFKEGDIARQRHCTGVAAFRANVGYVAAIDGHPALAHQSTLLIGADRERYFASDAEFVAHHKPGQEGGRDE